MGIQLELFLQKQVVLFLESEGWLVIQNSQRKGAGVHECFGFKAGVPDLLILKNERIMFLELKSEKFNSATLKYTSGRLSNDQKNMHSLIKAQGFQVHTVKNMTEVQNLVSCLK